MHIGLVGLGKMGGNMRERLRGGGHTVVGFDHNPEISDADSLADLVQALPSPKVVWVMVPSGDPTRATITELQGLLGEGDLLWVELRAPAALAASGAGGGRARRAC